MSCLTKSQFKYPSSGREKFYFTDDGGDADDFDFQYVPADQFKHIIKDVRRQRIREEEERVWTSFLQERELSISNYDVKQTFDAPKSKSTRTLAESLEDVDRELMRLEADALPETINRVDINSARDNRERSALTKSTKKHSPNTKDNGTGSSNFLLAIPEEENAYYAAELSASRKPCKAHIKKSCSEQTFSNRRIHSRCYHYCNNDMDYNSTPEISPDRLSDDNDFIPVHPDPVAVTKILSIQRKISTVLDSISYELDRIPLPDGENDLLRRQQRVIEFSTRLSRNYLYDLNRQIADIQRHIKAITPNGKIKVSRRGMILHMQAIEQKLISTHQLLLTALSAYWKHIPSSVLKNHPGKLKEILEIVIQIKNICIEIKLNPEFYCSGDDRDAFLGKETENRCSAILSKFRTGSDNESQVQSHTTRSTVATPSRNKKQRNRKMLSNRLSMYTMDMRLAKSYQPKKTHSMYQIPRDRRHNSATMKQQNNGLSVSKKSRFLPFSKTSTENIGNNKVTKISVPLKEDDIQTMMETVTSDLAAESLQSVRSCKRVEIYEKSQKSTGNYESKESERLNKNRKNNNKETFKDDNDKEKCLSSLLPVIGDLLSFVQNKQNDSKSLPKTSIDTLYDFLQTCQPQIDLDKVETYTNDEIKTGEKNMRLICYAAEEKKEKTEIFDTGDNEVIEEFNDASCQVNRSKNNGTCKLLVSDTATIRLTDYRNECENVLKSNPLYTSNAQNKPWEIVAWIADKLVEELIVELSDEFQMEDVIQKLFDLEFQEF